MKRNKNGMRKQRRTWLNTKRSWKNITDPNQVLAVNLIVSLYNIRLLLYLIVSFQLEALIYLCFIVKQLQFY
jgi:hypothetical protein